MSPTLARAYAACEAMAASHYENFPVASRLLPAGMRPHIAAVYAFARVADDIADEGNEPADVRLARLNEWQQRLHQAALDTGTPNAARRSESNDSEMSRDDLIFVALGHSIRVCDLPLQLFDDLLSAFAQDTTTTRYDSWTDVLDYCRRSANPVGRLVLRIAGYRDAEMEQSSDALCTALQLANFWQDFGRDWRAGRLYVPRDVHEASGASIDELRAGRITHGWTDAMVQCIARTRAFFDQGRLVCDRVRGRLRLELRLTWLGGSRILDRVEQRGAALLVERPTLGAGDVPSLLWSALRWRHVAT